MTFKSKHSCIYIQWNVVLSIQIADVDIITENIIKKFECVCVCVFVNKNNANNFQEEYGCCKVISTTYLTYSISLAIW